MAFVGLDEVMLCLWDVFGKLELLAHWVEHIARDGDYERRHRHAPEHVMIRATGALYVVRVHGLSQHDVGHGIETARVELYALHAQVVLHIEDSLLLCLHSGTAKLCPVGWVRAVGHHGHHPGHAETGAGWRVCWVVSVLPERVSLDRLPLALADANLPGLVPARRTERSYGHHFGCPHLQRPLQCLHASHAAADYTDNARDAELRQYLSLQTHHVADRHSWEAAAIALARHWVGGRGACGAVAASQHVGAEDAEAMSVQRLSGPDEIPPPGTSVGIARERVADHNDIVTLPRQEAPGHVAHLNTVEHAT
mmetsp:Transcript_59239/g.137988  ORF Transcript_59239/g.137988 Transcript_59239/m.137988 type:complete len:310 (-) Transcript_59239:163-1092(-)